MARALAGVVPFVTLVLAGPARAQQPADLIVVDAVVHTMDPDHPRAEALAVTDGRIVAVGAAADILPLRGEGTEVIQAGGRAVVPGLIDAHGHVMGLGRALRVLDLVGTESPEEIADRVRATAAEREPGEWIFGRGWDQNDWADQEFPTHHVLDAAAPENPVWLGRVDGHAGWANARAMEAAGVTAETADPDGGRIVRDASGAPTGVFIDNAEILVDRAVAEPGDEELEDRLAAARDHLLSVGLTGVHDMGVGPGTVERYRAWDAAGRLGPRIVGYLSGASTLEWWLDGGRESAPGERFRVAGVKFFADGALGSRGAALLEPYADDPGNSGLFVTPPDSLAAGVARVVEAGLQPAIHAIGDAGNRGALDAIERSAAAAGALPPRIEHAQVIALDDIPRFASLGVVASVQPTHATSDMYWAEERVGAERIRGAYAWRKLRDVGATLVCGSDFPVERANPFHGIHAAVTRIDAEGWPEGGWRPEERMTREEALACFTRDAAAVAGMADEVGTLAPGLRADFLVLDADPMSVPEAEIRGIGVVRTVMDGRTVWATER